MTETERMSERERRKAEAREAQAMLDSLEPGSDQAAKLIDSASRKGIKLRVRHTLVDRAAIESLTDGLRRDYERHQSELAEQRRKKLLRVGAALGIAMLVAAAVVVLSGLYVRSARAPEAGASTGSEQPRAAKERIGVETAAPANPAPAMTSGVVQATPQRVRPEATPPRALPVPLGPTPAEPSATPAPKAAEPLSPAAPEAADPSPKPAPSNKIEPYFGATP